MINLNDFPKNQNCNLIEQLNDTAYFRRQTLLEGSAYWNDILYNEEK